MSRQVKENTDIQQFTVKLEEAIQTKCSEICRQKNPSNTEVKGRMVPWLTETLKIMRKRTNALRRQ
jgi:hypothetical protein